MSLALIPAYTIVPLLVLVGGFAVRSRGRVHPGVWMSTVIATLSPTSTTVAETFPLAASTLCIADSP